MAKKKKKSAVDDEISADDLGIPQPEPTKKPVESKKLEKPKESPKKKTEKKTSSKRTKSTAKKSTKSKKDSFIQSTCNVGLVGHVDHGKTTLVKALSGTWTERYADEVNRGITIKLGYAEAAIYECPSCNKVFTTSIVKSLRKSKKAAKDVCPYCGEKLQFKRRISFVDAPGHEILMATMLSGASLMDGAILLVAANEPVGMPQTKEHLAALTIAKIENLIIVQNKVDSVSKEQALEHYQNLRKFLQKYPIAKNAPIIPVSSIFGANIDKVVEAIEKIIPSPELDADTEEFMFNVARSFDVNKPGTEIEQLQGGVIGGSIISGTVSIGDQVEIRPGLKNLETGKYHPVITTIKSIYEGSHSLQSASSGGLIALGTELDPSNTRTDQLIGNVLGTPETLPDVKSQVLIESHLLDKVLGAEKELDVTPLKNGEVLMIVTGTSLSVGSVIKIGKKNTITLKLKRPICALEGSIVALSRQIKNRFRLIGYGYLL